MQYMKYTAGFVLTLILAGCGSSSGNDNSDLVIDTSIGPAPAAAVPVTGSNKQNTISLTPNTAPVVSSSAGLNPAHGQPGHRCDIAVGAPLDSKPVSNTAVPATQPTVTPAAPANTPGINISMPSAKSGTVAPVSSTTTTASGPNPAHGQPGHRCDIAVGAPLDSKPAAQPTVTQSLPLIPSDAVKATPVVTPVKNETVAAVAPGMNPAHGQSGHRCDIAVGAPLNSKPEPAKK